VLRVSILTVGLTLVAPVLVGAQTSRPPPCPLADLVGPAMEGTSRFVPVDQPRPCPPNGAREDFLVTTDFGDGTITQTPFRPGDDLWLVGGDHAYRRAGTYELVGTITDRKTNQVEVLRRTVTVANAPLKARRVRRPVFPAARRATRLVGRFADANRLAAPGDYRVRISWGDGSRSRGTASKADDETFKIRGTHRYRTRDARQITVTVRDDRGAKLKLRIRPKIRR